MGKDLPKGVAPITEDPVSLAGIPNGSVKMAVYRLLSQGLVADEFSASVRAYVLYIVRCVPDRDAALEIAAAGADIIAMTGRVNAATAGVLADVSDLGTIDVGIFERGAASPFDEIRARLVRLRRDPRIIADLEADAATEAFDAMVRNAIVHAEGRLAQNTGFALQELVDRL